MKKLLLATFILLFAQSNVFACIKISEIDDGSVTIKLDDDPSSGMYHVRAPKEYNGSELEFLILSANDGENEIATSLVIRSKNGVTGSHFYMSSKWLNVKVSASYKGKKCTSLIANMGM